jgi:hypothetical protein
MRGASGKTILQDPDLVEKPVAIADHPLSSWIVVPRTGFVDIPIGLMTVLSFGNSYTRTSSVFVNLTRPICDGSDYRTIEYAFSTWLYQLGDNASVFYEEKQPTVDQANAIDIDIRVCYGPGLETLEFVTTECCNRLGQCGATDTKSVIAYVLLVGATTLAFIVAVATCWYVVNVVAKTDVHLSARYHLDIADKTRVVLAHLLAPWIILSHMYFTFEVASTPAAVVWFLDVAVAAQWPVAVVIRLALPLHTFSKPVYYASGTLLLGYSTMLMANAVVWIVSALNLSVQLLPFGAALLLIIVQIYWAVQWAQEALGPGVLSDEQPTHSLVPVDAALSVEYFAIIAILFMFAIGQVEDLSPFYAVVAAVVITLFFWIYNFSFGAQITAALKKHLGGPEDSAAAGGTAAGPGQQRRQMLQKVFSTAKLQASRGAQGSGNPGPGSGGAPPSRTTSAFYGDEQTGGLISTISSHFTAPLLGREAQDDEEGQELMTWRGDDENSPSPLHRQKTKSQMLAGSGGFGHTAVPMPKYTTPTMKPGSYSSDSAEHSSGPIPQRDAGSVAKPTSANVSRAAIAPPRRPATSHGFQASGSLGDTAASPWPGVPAWQLPVNTGDDDGRSGSEGTQVVEMSPRLQNRLEQLAAAQVLDQLQKDELI